MADVSGLGAAAVAALLALVLATGATHGADDSVEDSVGAAADRAVRGDGGAVPEGNLLVVLPPDWLPNGYLRPGDPVEANPFRVTSGAQFLERADRYVETLLADRAREGEARYADLDVSVRRAVAAILDSRRGRHRVLTRLRGDRDAALRHAFGIAFDGGLEAEREGEPEFYGRVVFVMEPDEANGYEITEGTIAEADRLSRPGGLVPSLEVEFLPLSLVEERESAAAVAAHVRERHLSLDAPYPLEGYARRVDRLVAGRVLEQTLLEELRRRMNEDTSSRRPRRDVFGEVRFGEERGAPSMRFVFRDHESGARLPRQRREALDLYRYRTPNRIGSPTRNESPSYVAERRRIETSAASRRYRLDVSVRDGHAGPLVFELPEYLDRASTIVSVRMKEPGEGEELRSVETVRAGRRFVPTNLGYRLDAPARRDATVIVYTVPPGDYRFEVLVVGRRFGAAAADANDADDGSR